MLVQTKLLIGEDLTHNQHFDIPQYEIDQGYSDEFMRAFKCFVGYYDGFPCQCRKYLFMAYGTFFFGHIKSFERFRAVTDGVPDDITIVVYPLQKGKEDVLKRFSLSSFRKILLLDSNHAPTI